MKNIIIRTNFNNETGLGHVFRMKNLAQELSKKSKITFYLDKHDKLTNKILNFDCEYLYKKNEKFKNQKNDSIKLKNKIKNKKIDCIIVDDYRLDSKWERLFYKKLNLVVFDDNNSKKHFCDIIVDAKWTGITTNQRYTNLVNKKTLKLCGPNYSIINSYKKKNKSSHNILFYIGGGGEFKKYYGFLNYFSNALKHYKNYKIVLICGPLVKNKKDLLKITKKLKNIRVVSNSLNVSKILSETDIYIGVSSSIIYELNYHNILSILFSSSKNQKNDITHLRDLGFNFLITKSDIYLNPKKVSKFLILIIKNLKRVKKNNQRKICVDENGRKRISANIFNLINKTKNKNNKYNINNPYIQNEEIYKKNGFYNVTDCEMNNYLISKNLFLNRKNSINTNKIKNLDHYIWWFTQKSKLFYFIRDNKIRIYLNHRKININNKLYYYGGWFVSKNKAILSDALNVVDWQTKKFSKYNWLAIIKKKNKAVYKLNNYLKFKKIKFKKIHKKFFNIKNEKKYYLLKK
tara:strand:+ start:1723 stop:3276 length:1554 start_codon:yes stop_codon:yes gene_type:complete